MDETLANLLRMFLDAKGWEYRDLAEKSGVSLSGIRKLLAGRVASARGSTVHDLAKALGVPPKRVRAAIEVSRRLAGK